jgi:hypothetical protein
MTGKDLSKDATLTLGQTPSGTNAQTAKPGGYLLNPYFSAYLQNYPKEWTDCGRRMASRSAAKAKSKTAPPSSADTEIPSQSKQP